MRKIVYIAIFLMFFGVFSVKAQEIFTSGRTTEGFIVQDEGTTIPYGPYLNFTGVGVAATSDSVKTYVSITGGSGATTEAQLETNLADVANVYTDNDTALLVSLIQANDFSPTDIDTDYGNETIVSTWDFTVATQIDQWLSETGNLGLDLDDDGSDLTLHADVGGVNSLLLSTDGAFFELIANPGAGNGYLLASITETQGADTEMNFYEGGTGHNRFWSSGSVRIGGAKNYLCSELTSDVDCDTATSGADLVIEDDIHVGGEIYFDGGIYGDGSGLSNLPGGWVGTAESDLDMASYMLESSSGVFVDADDDGTADHEFKSNGWVGLGTSNPAREFQFHENATGATYYSFTNNSTGKTSANGMELLLSTANIGMILRESGMDFYFDCPNDSGNCFWLMQDGKLGLGTNTPATTLDVNGTVTATAYIGGTESIYLPVQSSKRSGAFVVFTPSGGDATTIGASLDAGDGNWRLLFDATTDEGAMWQFRLPDYWTAHSEVNIFYTMASATTLEVEFEVAVMCVSDGDSVDIGTASFAAVAVGSATVPGTAGYPDEVSITVTDDSCAAGDMIFLFLSTDADDGTNDDATGDREVVGVEYEFTK